MEKKSILGLHIRGNNNVGDNYCHPLDYFTMGCDLDFDVTKADLKTPPDYQPDYVIFGGGAIAKKAPEVRELYPDARLIAWGVGYTNRGVFTAIDERQHYKLRSGFALYGCRDYIPGAGLDYAPCVSCMHPFFDRIPSPSHDVVVYGHAKLGALDAQAHSLGFPYMDNLQGKGSLGQVLAHIAAGAVVVTSSYHGAYWASLMGRRVVMLPFGSKFMSLKYRPPVATSVQEGVQLAQAFPDALHDARQHTSSFYERVKKLIHRY